MVYLIIIFFFHTVIGQIIENIPSKLLNIFFSVLLTSLFLIFTLGITDTADWTMYYYHFKSEYDETDYVFYSLSKLFNKNDLSYKNLYVFHILITFSLYFILINKFSRNFFYVFLAYIIFDYVHYVNQIRYYMGFPILMLGFYYLFYQKNYILSVILILFSFLCHSALAVLVIYIPIYIIPVKNYLKILCWLSGLVFIIVYMIFNLGIGNDIAHFGEYLDKDNISSFSGGFFNALPYIVCLVFLLYENRKILPQIDQNSVSGKQYIYVYKLSFFPLIFVPGALILQIVGHRYIMPFAIFWIINYLYVLKMTPKNKRVIKFLLFAGVMILCNFIIYILPDYLLPENHFKDQLELIIKSIKYLKGYMY